MQDQIANRDPAVRPGDAHPGPALVLIRCVGGCGLLVAAVIKSKTLAYLLLPLFLL